MVRRVDTGIVEAVLEGQRERELLQLDDLGGRVERRRVHIARRGQRERTIVHVVVVVVVRVGGCGEAEKGRRRAVVEQEGILAERRDRRARIECQRSGSVVLLLLLLLLLLLWVWQRQASA